MVVDEVHEGGCSCGAVRYKTKGKPERAGVCHCRYCQTRTGSAFGISVYFKDDNIERMHGILEEYQFKNESGRKFIQEFCPKCATTLFWTVEVFKGMTGVAGGSFDPPSFWYDIDREVFCRTSAAWINNDIDEKHDTHPNYEPVISERNALRY